MNKKKILFYINTIDCGGAERVMTNLSRQFAKGNPRYLVGMSGAELADEVVEASGGTILKENDGTFTVGPEYWTGWVLAYYQWLSCRSFSFIHRKK